MGADARQGQAGRARSAQVTPLSHRDVPMGRSVLGELKDHWRELKAGSMHLPRRADLDTSRIVGALPRSPILERPSAGAPRFRVAGCAGAGFVGSKPQDIPSSALIAPGSWAGFKL